MVLDEVHSIATELRATPEFTNNHRSSLLYIEVFRWLYYMQVLVLNYDRILWTQLINFTLTYAFAEYFF